MGYFSNATEHDMYVAEYCERCLHGQDSSDECPIMSLHWLWNYDAVGKNADPTKKDALEMFIPRDKDGNNEQCRMFVPAIPES